MTKRSIRNPFSVLLLIGYLLSIPCSGIAQSLPEEKDENRFGNIPDSLFSMQEYSSDPEAPFFYVFKDVDITFEDDDRSLIAVLDYHVRIKVFSDTARQASLVTIPYYFEDGIEEVSDIRGLTVSPSGTETELQEDDIRTINVNSRYNVKEFSLPDVQDGAVLEYAYQIRRRYLEELPDFFLAHRAPTALARVTITYPQYLRYDVIPSDFSGSIYRHTQLVDTSSVAKIFTEPRPDPILIETWETYDIPALEPETYISSIDDYRGKLKFKLSEFGNPRQVLENSWDFVVAELRRNQNGLSVIENNEQAQKMGSQIANELPDPEAAQDSIFRVVNQSANFSGNRAPFSQIPDTEVLAGNLADQPAINQTLIAMLRGAGIEAYPVLISTREFGSIERDFPSFFQFNAQIVHSRIGNEDYFMDASFAHSQPDLIPVATYNGSGLVLKSESFEWIDVEPDHSRYVTDIRVEAALDDEGNLSGTVYSENSGYTAQLIRDQLAGGEQLANVVRAAIFDGYTNVELTNINLQNVNRFDRPVRIEADFELENYATSFSDGLEFRPMVLGYLMENPFDDTNRNFPVTLDAPETLNLEYKIVLPGGFTFEEGVGNNETAMPGASLAEFYSSGSDTLSYSFDIDISKKEFNTDEFPTLFELYERWVTLSNGNWLIERE